MMLLPAFQKHPFHIEPRLYHHIFLESTSTLHYNCSRWRLVKTDINLIIFLVISDPYDYYQLLKKFQFWVLLSNLIVHTSHGQGKYKWENVLSPGYFLEFWNCQQIFHQWIKRNVLRVQVTYWNILILN